MTSKKKEFADSATDALIPSPSYLLVQTAMLFLHYGLKYDMPWWVTWFPSVIYFFVLVVILILIIIVAIVSAIIE